MDVRPIVEAQRAYYQSGATIPVNARVAALKTLQTAVKAYQEPLLEALHTDLGKSASEAYMCEVGLTLSEIAHVLKHVRRWARTEWKMTAITNSLAHSTIVKEPYGVALIMSPWNYPVLLTLEPLVGALAAGNTVILKPSAYAPATSEVLKKMVDQYFDPQLVAMVTGGREENKALLQEKFDYIFFTGGVTVGKYVMTCAAEHLTPVTLELGGKSPVVIDSTANLWVAAKRVAFGKYLNCGQTCVAPDYVLIDEAVKDKFVELLKKAIKKMYTDNALTNKDYGHMINKKHFDRVCGLIDPKKVVYGGQTNIATMQISPTVLDNVTAEDAVMQEEIFGPVLPILTYKSIDEAYRFVQQRPHPLALYLFTNDKKTEQHWLSSQPFGGGCVNDTIIHLATNNLPFGGVGNSGMGSYHGRQSFDTFSHKKSIVKKYNWLDLSLRYQPYNKLKDWLVKMFLH